MEYLPGDVAAHIGTEEYTDIGNFLRLPSTLHRNPQKHGLIHDFKKWKYSSYGTFLSKSKTQIETDWVLDWFGGLEEFEKNHLFEEDNQIDFREFEDF